MTSGGGQEIDPAGGGRWAVTTASGARYLIDLDQSTVTRSTSGPTSAEWERAALRRDGHEVPLLALVHARAGDVAVLLLQVRDDRIPTTRTIPHDPHHYARGPDRAGGPAGQPATHAGAPPGAVSAS